VDPAIDGGRRYNRASRRRVYVLASVALVIAAAVGAALLTTTIKSPAQQAAETRPPAQTDLTATVQRTVLTSTVLAQAVVQPPREVSPSIIGSSAGSAGQNVQQIVTKIFHRAGSLAYQGSVLLEVAGQPFFLLQGTVPAYRNMEPGESGQDIAQLQDDLISLGYGISSDTTGEFGPGTSAAVTAFYKAIGYAPPRNTVGAKANRGAVVPLGEYSFVPRLPARIVKMDLTVGQSATAGGLVLAMGSPVIIGQLNPSVARLIGRGMLVTITEPGTGVTLGGQVTSVSGSTAAKASISGGLYVKMGIRASQPLPMSLVGQDVSLTITDARSSGPVLAVPEAAVFAGVDGGTFVNKVVDGKLVRVPVRVGMSGSGLLQVTPAHPGALTAGDQVVTGENYAGSIKPGPVKGSGP
jgi:peptidoglycan hydrolase-like protein with peptidoglycan-binding domain